MVTTSKLSIATASILLLLISCVTNNTSETSGPQHPLEAYADSIFQANVDSGYIAGAAVIVFQGDEYLVNKSYGFASLELSTPIPENASFEIGSITKQFTSAAILRLVEAGKLSLEDDFTKYVPFDTRGRTVTINHLLNHTSGIPGYTELPFFRNFSIEKHERDSLVRIIEKEEFLFEPGSAMIYNNSGYFLLGLVIEAAAGKTYEEYLSEQFFQPLGMENTYYCSETKVFSGKVYGYNYAEKGLHQKPYLDHTWPFAAGSLCSTTKDLLVWMQALHGGKVFQEETYKLLTTPGTLNDGSLLRYAMGVTNMNNFGNHVIGHGGGINGFLSYSGYFTDADMFIICLVNTTGPKGAYFFADNLIWKNIEKKEATGVPLDFDLKILEGKYSGAVRGRTLNVEIKALQGAVSITSAGRDGNEIVDTLKTYIGDYTWMEDNTIVIIKNGEYRRDMVNGYYILKRME